MGRQWQHLSLGKKKGSQKPECGPRRGCSKGRSPLRSQHPDCLSDRFLQNTQFKFLLYPLSQNGKLSTISPLDNKLKTKSWEFFWTKCKEAWHMRIWVLATWIKAVFIKVPLLHIRFTSYPKCYFREWRGVRVSKRLSLYLHPIKTVLSKRSD